MEIRTDPKATEYVVTEGARRRDTGDDAAVAERVGGVLVGGAGEEEERVGEVTLSDCGRGVGDEVRFRWRRHGGPYVYIVEAAVMRLWFWT